MFQNYFQRFTIILFVLGLCGFYIARNKQDAFSEDTSNLDFSRNTIICGIIYSGLILSIFHYAMDSFIYNFLIFVILFFMILVLIRIEVVRFFFVWIILFFTPPFLMGVGTRHQMLESAAGLVCLCAVGLIHIWDWWKSRFSSKIEQSFTIPDHLSLLCVPVSITFIVITILLHLTVEPGQIITDRINFSLLNRDVGSYLETVVSPGSEITATRLPGMITSYDILLELQLRNKKFQTNTITDYFSPTADFAVIAGEITPYADRKPGLKRFQLIKRFTRGPYFAEIFRKKTGILDY